MSHTYRIQYDFGTGEKASQLHRRALATLHTGLCGFPAGTATDLSCTESLGKLLQGTCHLVYLSALGELAGQQPQAGSSEQTQDYCGKQKTVPKRDHALHRLGRPCQEGADREPKVMAPGPQGWM